VELTKALTWWRDQTEPQQPHWRGRKNEEKTYLCLYMRSHYLTKKNLKKYLMKSHTLDILKNIEDLLSSFSKYRKKEKTADQHLLHLKFTRMRPHGAHNIKTVQAC